MFIWYRSERHDMKPEVEPCSLRGKLEKPLLEVDEVITRFSKEMGHIRTSVLSDYRDGVNRTIFWRKGRMVQYIQIRLIPNEEEVYNTIHYKVFACAYKIRVPFLHFGNARFGGWGQYRKDIGILQAPIDRQKLENLLKEAYQILKPITRINLRQQKL